MRTWLLNKMLKGELLIFDKVQPRHCTNIDEDY